MMLNKVLLTNHRNGFLLNQSRANSVGTFDRLLPTCAGA
ncbi:Uncharacterised protein [Vibrio cholerae]|nr:Uncharacterised protein [Vibrio cholerae]CSI79572.1 Uncharacterised protein [Vibrio cholerae]